MRVLLRVAYDGTGYSGWQIQPNAVTVEKVLIEALEGLFGKKVEIIGASRTECNEVASFGAWHAIVFDEDITAFTNRANNIIGYEVICVAGSKILNMMICTI